MSGELILVVEDKETNRKLVRDVLQFKGFEVAEAVSAEEGLEMARARRPALILMDIHLPGMDGFAALTHLAPIPRLARFRSSLLPPPPSQTSATRSWRPDSMATRRSRSV